jgi:hypothetical protein
MHTISCIFYEGIRNIGDKQGGKGLKHLAFFSGCDIVFPEGQEDEQHER